MDKDDSQCADIDVDSFIFFNKSLSNAEILQLNNSNYGGEDTTPPVMTAMNCTSCGDNGDSVSPFTTTDTTPTFNVTTDENAKCRIADVTLNYGEMGEVYRNCTPESSYGTSHICTLHPDDELIWMGGTLMQNKENWKTTIISLCRADDKDRNPKFHKACKILGVKCYMEDIDDEKLSKILSQEYIKKISKYSTKDYDHIFTHNANGEYGHIRHKEIHKAVKEMLKRGTLKSKKVFFFSYKKMKNN